MLTSARIRQQFLDFFREKQHTIVPSSSLLPDSPNLLFTSSSDRRIGTRALFRSCAMPAASVPMLSMHWARRDRCSSLLPVLIEQRDHHHWLLAVVAAGIVHFRDKH